MVHTQYKEQDVVSTIMGYSFSPLSAEEIEQCSVVNITREEYYNDKRKPIKGGSLDARMGVNTNDADECAECGQGWQTCPGHFGCIDLHLPVFHTGHQPRVIDILKCICKTCSRVLLKQKDRERFGREIKQAQNDYEQKKRIHKKVIEACGKNHVCPDPRCNARNGAIRKMWEGKICHVQLKNVGKREKDNVTLVLMDEFKAEMVHDSTLRTKLQPEHMPDVFLPQDVLRLFDSIPCQDLSLLSLAAGKHPRQLLITRVAVPPNPLRKSVVNELRKGTTEDDITVLLSSIVSLNNEIGRMIETGKGPAHILEKQQDALQIRVSVMVNAEVPLPAHLKEDSKKTYTGLSQRLKGKQGRFRNNLMGKRVNFTARTVISPDINLRIDEVGVPRDIAKILTYPERVNEHNISLMRQLIMNGEFVHPGANAIEQKSGRTRKLGYVNEAERRELSENLQMGEVVRRHLMDRDVVLFNRQPSLHKMSIMAHRVKVLPHKTLRFNICVCGPYNADFDGDEMNLHLPQTEEARAEALDLMLVTNNLVTPRSGGLIIGCSQDLITGCYLLTKKDVFFTRAEALRLLNVVAPPGIPLRLQIPALVKPVEMWTGKQLFSAMLRMNAAGEVNVNLRHNKCKDKTCGFSDEMCSQDNYVHICNSELISGVMDKSMIGATDNKRNVFYVIYKDYGKRAAVDAMYKAGKIAIEYLMNRGCSIGLGDLSPTVNLLEKKSSLINDGYSEVKSSIEQYEQEQIQCDPGCDSEETLEGKVLKVLSNVRKVVGDCLTRELKDGNTTQIMTVCGSKGSAINMCQMMGCVGQQAINNKRIHDGFGQRSLPHFQNKSKLPEAKGFVSNSFYSGMEPYEMFFHTMAGREGLVDTAVKTAETGYMQRRLVKCLEDLHTAADGTVRNCDGMVLQFKFGEDGLDPACIEISPSGKAEEISLPLDFERIFDHIRKTATSDTSKEVYDLSTLARLYLDDLHIDNVTPTYKEQIIEFLRKHEAVCKRTLPSSLQSQHITKSQLGQCVREEQLIAFLKTVIERYVGSATQTGVMMPHGSLVGASCAQSIGEPATQMTLKTFHFAGVASMNITQGVPRINEIINATKDISTPIITAQLLNNTDMEKACECRARIEKITLKDIVQESKWVGAGDAQKFMIRLSCTRINLMKLKVNAETVKCSIVASKSKLNHNVEAHQIHIKSQTVLEIHPAFGLKAKNQSFTLQMDKIWRNLPYVPIVGLPTVSRAVIYERPSTYVWKDKTIKRTSRCQQVPLPASTSDCDQPMPGHQPMDGDQPMDVDSAKGATAYQLCVEGNNMKNIIATYGVDGVRVTSNNILEVQSVLGIEAARQTIINELNTTMRHHGLSVDPRHISLLANRMTAHGNVTGVNRHGLAKTCNKVFTMASFEQTADHLFQAAYHGETNSVTGISDSIIIGKAMPMGTGMVHMMQQHREPGLPLHRPHQTILDRYAALCPPAAPATPRRLIFDQADLHPPAHGA